MRICRLNSNYLHFQKLKLTWQRQVNIIENTSYIFYWCESICIKYRKVKNFSKNGQGILPFYKTIGCFARITDIMPKSLEDLKELRALGYDGITIGVETGDDESLTFMNKGFQSKDVLEQCRKLDEAGISYNFFYLTGIYGAGRGEVGAKKTAMLFNQLNPKIIESSMLTIYKTSELYQEIQKGNWKEESEIEKLIELKTLVENLTINTRIVLMVRLI